jgi:hypothetical protein
MRTLPFPLCQAFAMIESCIDAKRWPPILAACVKMGITLTPEMGEQLEAAINEVDALAEHFGHTRPRPDEGHAQIGRCTNGR